MKKMFEDKKTNKIHIFSCILIYFSNYFVICDKIIIQRSIRLFSTTAYYKYLSLEISKHLLHKKLPLGGVFLWNPIILISPPKN